MSAPTTSRIGCLAPFAFVGWVLIGWALSMPAAVFYLYRHDPAQLQRSEHWLLIAGMAPVGAALTAWWTTRNQPRPIHVIAIRAAALLLINFVGTTWVLEANAIPAAFLQVVVVWTGWGSIAVFALVVPLLNWLFGVGRPAMELPPEPPPFQLTQHRPGPRAGGRGPRPKRTRARPQKPEADRPRAGQDATSGATRGPAPRGDGKPVYRDGPPAAAAPRTPQPRTPQPRTPQPRTPGDGKPVYRTGSPPPPPPRGDGKPVYRNPV